MIRLLSFFAFFFVSLSVTSQSSEELLYKAVFHQNQNNQFGQFQYGDILNTFDRQNEKSQFLNNERHHKSLISYSKLELKKRNHLLEEQYRNELSYRKNEIALELANNFFKARNYKVAKKWYALTNSDNIENSNKYNFQRGYTFLQTNKESEAIQYLEPISQSSSHPYYKEANYYMGIYSFNKGEYPKAKSYLYRINQIDEYKDVDYLLAQIHYIDGKYDKTVSILEKSSNKDNIEIVHLLASSYFELNDFKKAKNKFKEFVLNTSKVDPEDMYKLAFSTYKVEEYKEAIQYFKELQLSEKFGQYSMYALGDCYLKTNDKKNALTAFMSAEKYSKDEEIKEVSSFNVAKLQFDLKDYNIANLSFERFIRDFPKSKYINEAQSIYTQSLLLSNNYPKAINYLEANPRLLYKNEKLYQEITYTYAVNAYNNGDEVKANKYLSKSLSRIKNQPLAAEAHYLKAEMYFKNKKYSLAREEYNEVFAIIYKNRALFSQNATLFNCHYGLGYCDYMQKKYDRSLMHFKECTKNFKYSQKDPSSNVLQDVELRIGDVYFLQKKYAQAYTQYSKITKNNDRGYDYATLQKAKIEGVRKNHSNKIFILNKLLKEVPNSVYRNEAKYQLGLAYEDNFMTEQAINTYTGILGNKSYSEIKPKATIRLATIFYNSGDKSKALKYYTNVVEKYPNSAQTDQSLKAIKEIFLSDGKAEEYISYINSLPNAKRITASAQDSILFETGEEFFANSKYDQAINIFNKYIDKFGNGKFIHKAHYLKAESYVEKKQYSDAINEYDILIKNSGNPYYETALVKSAYYNYNIKKNYDEAKSVYEKLLQFATKSKNSQVAKIGLLQSNFKLKDYNKVIEIADLIDKDKNIDYGIKKDAVYYKAISLYRLNKFNEAVPMLNVVLENKNSYRSAECSYFMAEIAHKKKQYQLSNDILFKAKDDYGSYQDWIVKYYVLIGYNYHKLGDDFQAKATLESIVQNYQGDQSIIDDAKSKLLEVNESIRSNSQVNYQE